MSLHNGLDTMAIATIGIYSGTYGAAHPGNIANLFASLGIFEDAPSPTTPTVFKRVWDWFWEFF